jgi:hypothetical protein
MHGHDDVLRVGDWDLVENLVDIAADVDVRAQEHAQQVAAADDADELAVLVDHRQPPDVVRIHQPGRGRDGRVGVYRDGRRGHQGPGGQAHMRPLAVQPPPVDRTGHPGPAALLVLRGEQVGFGHHADDLPAHLQYRHPADPVLSEQPVDLLVRGDPVDGHHRGRHHVADPPGPPAVPRFVTLAGRAGTGGAGGAGMRRWLVQVLLHRVQCAGHVSAGGPAVQGLVVRGAEMAEHGIEVRVGARHHAHFLTSSSGRAASGPAPGGARAGGGFRLCWLLSGWLPRPGSNVRDGGAVDDLVDDLRVLGQGQAGE